MDVIEDNKVTILYMYAIRRGCAGSESGNSGITISGFMFIRTLAHFLNIFSPLIYTHLRY